MMQMAQPGFPPGMNPGHPGMPTGQHMGGMQHPGGGHMGGHPGPGMMQAMHPGVSGPQVTQGPMVTGMPHGVPTSAPGGPMQNAHAMAHLGPGQQPMFQQQPMAFAQMPPLQQQQIMQRRQQQMLMQQAAQQGHPMAMNMQQNMHQMNPQQMQQMAQLKANMAQQQQMPQNMQQMQMAANQQAAHNFQHQQRLAQQQQHQQAMQAQQRAQAQQMQISRSQEQTTQAPQPHPTPAPQTQPQPQSQSTPQPQQQAQPKQPQAQQGNQPQPQQSRPQQGDQQAQQDEPEVDRADMVEDLMPQQTITQDFSGRLILHLLSYQDRLLNMEKPNEIESWEVFVSHFFSTLGSVRQQIFNTKARSDKKFLIPYHSLARFFHAHFCSGIKKIIMSTFDCKETNMINGGHFVYSNNASFTYLYGNNIRVTTIGSVHVNFDAMNKIDHLSINTSDWSEYIPRGLLQSPESPDQKQDLKMNKGVKRQNTKPSMPTLASIPSANLGDYGLPQSMVQFLELAEILTAMGPLFEYYQSHAGVTPREALSQIVTENNRRVQMQNPVQMQNQMAMAMNGQIHPGQRTPGLNAPNAFNSPGMAHLGLPQQQGSPHIGGPVHTPSPAQMQNHVGVGGAAMMHQMSQQGSSQGPSTNTSPNVTNKRRRASQIKLEGDDGVDVNGGGASKVRPSPRIGGKRQKGTQ